MNRNKINAMAFYHRDGLVSSWNQASRFAGKKGRVATLPDIVDARLATVDGPPWEQYYTTNSAEYVGYHNGIRVIVVAHGVGPMSNLDGKLQAYKHGFERAGRSMMGGHITADEMNKLIAGEYGKVEVVNLEDFFRRYQHPFLEFLRYSQAVNEPLMAARYGPRWEEYLYRLKMEALVWHNERFEATLDELYWPEWMPSDMRTATYNKEQGIHERELERQDPYIVYPQDANNCTYGYKWMNRHGDFPFKLSPGLRVDFSTRSYLALKGGPLAHLLSIDGLQSFKHDDGISLVCETSAHEWSNGTRFVGVRSGKVKKIHEGFSDFLSLVYNHENELLLPSDSGLGDGLVHLMKIRDRWYSTYPKKGDVMDSWEPKYRVVSKAPVGEPIRFVTQITGYHQFVTYDTSEIIRLRPRGANAYSFTSEWEIVPNAGDPKEHEVMVQFWRAKIDDSRRLVKFSEIKNNFKLLMKLTLS